ncbi:hypothetical protein LIER_20592 [Lithospermum erythrorhizon]|uniref:Uncharacterized protein n=1 Tax=Lithospermum erythrorhizon TaxID=34254 RepID=A0AAV3QQ60_LITER
MDEGNTDDVPPINETWSNKKEDVAEGKSVDDTYDDSRPIQPASLIQKNHLVDNIIRETDQGSVEPSCVSEASAGDSGKNVTGSDGVDVSHSDTVIEDVEVSNTEGLGANVNPSVEDTLNGLKDSTPLGGAMMRPSVNDSVKENSVDGMDADIPSVVDIEPVTAKATENVTPSVTDTGADTVGQDDIDSVDARVEHVIPEKASQEKKKSKKRRLRKLADTIETSKPTKKLSKEERAAKKARKAERRARKAAEAKTVEDNDVEEVVPEETKEATPLVDQPSVDDEWLPEHEPQGDNEDDQLMSRIKTMLLL